jgi:hypothetical protein
MAYVRGELFSYRCGRSRRSVVERIDETGATGLEPATSGVTVRANGFVPSRSKLRDRQAIVGLDGSGVRFRAFGA